MLAPIYRTAAGIDALNERLAGAPQSRPAASALNERFRIGDRLIQTRNSHELGLMNGSICFLVEDDPDEEAIVVETDDGGSLVVPYEEAATLRLAYAISVHKSQGCEVPGGRLRLPPLPLPDADPAAALHGDHSRPERLCAGR